MQNSYAASGIPCVCRQWFGRGFGSISLPFILDTGKIYERGVINWLIS